MYCKRKTLFQEIKLIWLIVHHFISSILPFTSCCLLYSVFCIEFLLILQNLTWKKKRCFIFTFDLLRLLLISCSCFSFVYSSHFRHSSFVVFNIFVFFFLFVFLFYSICCKISNKNIYLIALVKTWKSQLLLYSCCSLFIFFHLHSLFVQLINVVVDGKWIVVKVN